MHNTSSNFKSYIKMPSRTLTSRLVIGTNTYTGTEIVDMSLESNLVPGEEFTLGSTICGKFEATLITADNIMSLNVIKPYIGLDINGVVEEVPLGVFTVDDVKIAKGNKKIIAYDNMIKFEKTYFSNLVYPKTIQAVAVEICQKAGVSFISALPSYSIVEIEGKTLREAVGIIAGICGGFARISRAGSLEIVGLTSTNETITTDNFFGTIEKADKNFNIKKIIVIKEDNTTLTSGSGMANEEVTFSNNYITQAQLNTMFAIYDNYNYRPLKFNWQGNPALDVGDKVSITDVDGVVYSIPVMRLKLTYQGGLKSEISSLAKSDSKSEYEYKGPVSKKIERLVIEQANIKVLMADKATIENLIVTNAKIDNANINIATINTLLAGNIGAANLAAGAIQAGSAIISNGAIGSAQISSLTANKLDAGTVDTSKVTIQGTNGRFKITGNRLQVFAGTSTLYERVSLGDVNGDGTVYGFRVRGSDGITVLLDETGVKREGITDGSINNDKIGIDAKINGTKLDIASVVTSINGGTETIDSSKVFLDNKTLKVGFESLATTVTGQGTTIGSHTGSIAANATAIGLKVATSTYNTKMTALDNGITAINTTLGTQASSISANAAQIALKVEQSDINTSVAVVDGKITTLSNRIGTAETSITANATAINLRATTSALTTTNNAATALTTRMVTAEGSIVTQAGQIVLKATITSLNTTNSNVTGITNRMVTAEGAITTQAGLITLKATQTSLDTTNNNVTGITSRMVTAEGTITTQSGLLALKATQVSLNATNNNVTGVTNRLTTAEGSITTQAGQIALKATITSLTTTNNNVTGVTNRLTTAEGSIVTQAGLIASKVAVDNLGTLITQNSSSVKVAVGQIGGNNLIKNGGFDFGTSSWFKNSGLESYGVGTADTKFDGNRLLVTVSAGAATGYQSGTFQSFPTKAGTTYIWQAMIYSDAPNGVQCGTGAAGVYHWAPIVDRGAWRLVTDTFVATTEMTTILFLVQRTTTGGGTSAFYLDNVKVEEGSNRTAWSPNPNELKSSTTEIADGKFRFTSNDGSYMEMVPAQSGLKWHKVDGDPGKDVHYLSQVGEFNVTSSTNWDSTIALAAEFKGKDIKILLAIKEVEVSVGYALGAHKVKLMSINNATPSFSVQVWATQTNYYMFRDSLLFSAAAVPITISWLAIA